MLVVRRPDGEVMMRPSADTVLRQGDRVTVFGLPEQNTAFLHALRRDGA